MNKLKVHFSSNRLDWETPDDLFYELDNVYQFDLDVCAQRHNAKCKRYIPPERNGLVQSWKGNCWMNPPYGRTIKQWVEKAFNEWQKGGCCVVCLLPARTDTAMFHNYIWDAAIGRPFEGVQVHFLRGRLTFKGASNPAPFPSMIVVFGNRIRKAKL